MEPVRQEGDPSTAISSSSSSFRSYADSPGRNRYPKGATRGSPQPIPPPNPQWISHFMSNFFACDLCNNILVNPVQLLPTPKLVCRNCALARRVASESLMDLPKRLQQAFDEVEELHRLSRRNGAEESAFPQNGAPDESIMKRRMVRVKRMGPAGGATGRAQSPAAPAAGAAAHAPRASCSPSRNAAHVPPSPRTDTRDLEDGEVTRRKKKDAGESRERVEMMKRHTASSRNIRKGDRPISKMLKKVANVKYRQEEFTVALELYTMAIEQQPNDCATRLSVLYENRSSAYFMAERYDDCIKDCERVIELVPENTRVYTRAAKAAAMMGDLKRALGVMESVPEALVTDNIQNEWKKYKQGLEIFEQAERLFDLSGGEEPWRMLVAQFSDTIPFRLRYGESLMRQKRYMKAVEALEGVSSSRRTPKLCYMMSHCLYLSGFEYFERARMCLAEVQQLDDGCAKLLRLINIVDEVKQKGNQLFQQKEFSSAVEHYTTAIQAVENNDKIMSVLLCNRAAAHKELGKYRECIDDCTKALQLDSQFSKAYARRARCHQLLNDFAAAIRDFKSAIHYDPSNYDLQRELCCCEHYLAKESERAKESECAKDYYYVLGLNRNSSDREIKRKYRELSLRWHPDKCMSLPVDERLQAERKFKMISGAYEVLKDPARRREYDNKTDRERLGRPGGFCGAGHYGSDAFRGQPSRYRTAPGSYW